MFPDLIKISSAVKSVGILSSYSDIELPAHIILFLRSLNSVSGSTTLYCKPAASVNVLKTDPNS